MTPRERIRKLVSILSDGTNTLRYDKAITRLGFSIEYILLRGNNIYFIMDMLDDKKDSNTSYILLKDLSKTEGDDIILDLENMLCE